MGPYDDVRTACRRGLDPLAAEAVEPWLARRFPPEGGVRPIVALAARESGLSFGALGETGGVVRGWSDEVEVANEALALLARSAIGLAEPFDAI